MCFAHLQQPFFRFFCKWFGVLFGSLWRGSCRAKRDWGREKVAFSCNLTLSLPPSRQSRATSQLPFRSVLLLRNGVHRTPAPSSEGGKTHRIPTLEIELLKNQGCYLCVLHLQQPFFIQFYFAACPPKTPLYYPRLSLKAAFLWLRAPRRCGALLSY